MSERVRPVATALIIGAAGASMAAALNLPAAALVGSSLSVSVAAACRVPVAMHQGLRNLAFASIGVSLGAGIDRSVAGQLGPWALSLALLMASILATLFGASWLLRRVFRTDRDTALLASSPGTMSYAVAVALDGRGNPAEVTVLQVIRLLSLVAIVPVLTAAFGGAPGPVARPEAMALAPLALILALSLGLGTLGARRKLPAAALLGGMLVSGAAHATGLVQGAAPGWLVFCSFFVTGTTLGTRLYAIRPAQLASLALAGLAVVAVAVAVSLAFAGVTSALTRLPFGQVWTAYAPGGVEAMAAIGLALGYDPAYVALHHFARILILVVVLPLSLGDGRS